jgi:ribosomal protein L7Ae-like RNA K-turn-binding protein
METIKLLRFIGLMKKANAASFSESKCEEDLRSGRSCLVLFASDCSERARSRMEKIASSFQVDSILLEFTKAELASALGTGSCSMISINDCGFAESFLTKISV